MGSLPGFLLLIHVNTLSHTNGKPPKERREAEDRGEERESLVCYPVVLGAAAAGGSSKRARSFDDEWVGRLKSHCVNVEP